MVPPFRNGRFRKHGCDFRQYNYVCSADLDRTLWWAVLPAQHFTPGGFVYMARDDCIIAPKFITLSLQMMIILNCRVT